MSTGAPSPDPGPAPYYGRFVVSRILILWYTASGTFSWAKGVGCTVRPERRLAVPWGPKLS